MFDIVTTKKNINLISADLLTQLIGTIEKRCAGWWWSINQESHRISLSMGPGKNCPRPDDLILSQTRLGDNGFIQTHPTGELLVSLLPSWLDRVFDRIDLYREDITRKNNFSGLHRTSKFRSQSNLDLLKLHHSYQELLDAVVDIEKAEYTLEQVYIGSCDFSVDCSLRGSSSGGDDFDFSHDYQHSAIIAESVDAALDELKKACNI